MEILPAPDHVAAIRIAGTIKAEDYDTIIPEIESKLEDHDRIGVYVDMEGFQDMTGEALRRDIKYGIEVGRVAPLRSRGDHHGQAMDQGRDRDGRRPLSPDRSQGIPPRRKSAALDWVAEDDTNVSPS